jgi:WD40 repeat protein
VGQPLRHDAEVYAVAFSPDGRTIVTGCHFSEVRPWDVATLKPLGPPFLHEDQVWTATFSPDGRTILTGSGDRTARLWPVPGPLSGEAARLVAWTQVLTGMEVDDAGVRALDAPTWRDRRRRLDELGGPP